ncbi:phosphatidylglycerol lysyltransferase domain-containing protein [Mesorhizobium xinjiangense]|uniref:phosphatidylglycerol lysyltransferase domain-containing protein n=1 Tax=Mesorhizobium xinjiangense TaxID=2678685 RepID=UPI0012EE3F97|nr:phosphatidylglycerol lysyltransferase domain-containing protein [Mesorhizobium xinjiangense]
MKLLRRTVDNILEKNHISAPDRELDAAERRSHLVAHGDFPLAYAAATEPYLKSFGDQRGFVAYGQKMGYTFAMGDPVAGAADRAKLIEEFIATFRQPSFAGISREVAEILAGLGYRITQFGLDSVLDLPGHSFAGKDGKSIRYATSWMRQNAITVEERPIEDFPAETIERMSQQWRRTRVNSRREIRFLNRSFLPQPEEGVRRFFAVDPAGKPIALISFDPIYRNGAVTGYLASSKRRYPETSSYVDLGIMRHATDCFREEGHETLWLGLLPMVRTKPLPGRDDPLLRAIFAWAYRSKWVNARIFSLQGIAAYKDRYRGRDIPVYVATPGRYSAVTLIALLRLIKLI